MSENTPTANQSPAVPPTVHELFSLKGKTALVTGGCGHLGTAMCHALAEVGASVIVSSRDGARAQKLAADLPTTKTSRHYGIELDHMQPDTLPTIFSQAIALTGQIDVLVNNGQEPVTADWTNVTAAQFTRQLENMTGYFVLSRLLRDHAVERQAPASLVLLGSMYGLVASYPDAYENVTMASPVAYHALKGGIVHMTRHLAVYWAKDRVRVNCLSPGPFPSSTVSPELVRRLSTKSPMGRMGHATELKGAIVFLASEASSYLTGQNLVVDGGWTAW